ncbi:methylated-DNA--[protein]-cysteine S-methyltransferase [Nonomuraea phyllanthi]|uniref:methylated-DNA--[protein]-cysteine S-methyltransferase n=1 Tax=Nonomuraea phyllanthi TaxID=2219224 RepID=UPI001293F806|nr:methylated-DNA--[protein]-cysteine S-methyltransferase [Nonomuraea phyllanthi]QFY06654.1 methylated-DNA--[protein]-cysteine S-methyltransferase [Nonomuraea phyllanthi]
MDIYTTIDTPLGELLLAGDGQALARVSFDLAARAGLRREPGAFAEAERQFAEYFAGERIAFDLPLASHGTPFQERVWEEVAALPYGTTTTYGALAARVGAPRDRIRAVGAAVGANPLLIVRPCHRVVGADGSLTGYAGGVERKHELLALEGVRQPRLWSVLS